MKRAMGFGGNDASVGACRASDFWGMFVLSVALWGCSGAATGTKATLDISVAVDSALNLKTVTVEVTTADKRSISREFPSKDNLAWLVTVSNLKGNTATTVVAKGFTSIDAGATPVVTYAVRATLGPTDTLRIPLKLSAGCNPGPKCGADENCELGACVKQPTVGGNDAGISTSGGTTGMGGTAGTGGDGKGDAAVDMSTSTGGAASGGSGSGGMASDAGSGSGGAGSGGVGGKGGAGGISSGAGGSASGSGGAVNGTGGAAIGTGGKTGSGGAATGGAPGSGGGSASGGKTGTGGTGTGGTGTGGAPVDLCLNNGGCSASAKCVASGSSRTCTCNSGYGGDGITCKKIDGQTCAGATECSSGQCVMATCCSGANCPECKGDGDCGSATKPLCVNTKCVACTTSTACKAKDATVPICVGAGGTNAGACVACNAHSDCTTVNKSICLNQACVSCVNTPDGIGANSYCAQKNPARPECDGNGANPVYGTCVECRNQSGCNQDRAFCNHSTGTCDPCNLATGTYSPNSACSTASTPSSSLNVCNLSTGKCVECATPGGRCNNGSMGDDGLCGTDYVCRPAPCVVDTDCTFSGYVCSQTGKCISS